MYIFSLTCGQEKRIYLIFSAYGRVGVCARGRLHMRACFVRAYVTLAVRACTCEGVVRRTHTREGSYSPFKTACEASGHPVLAIKAPPPSVGEGAEPQTRSRSSLGLRSI